MRKILMPLLVLLLGGLSFTGCSAIDDVLDDFINYSRLTIQEPSTDFTKYYNIKVTFDDKEFTALGTYQVPNNTIVNISWSYDCSATKHCSKKGNASKDVSVGSYENMTVTLDHGDLNISSW